MDSLLIVVNPPERKLAKGTSVQWSELEFKSDVKPKLQVPNLSNVLKFNNCLKSFINASHMEFCLILKLSGIFPISELQLWNRRMSGIQTTG